MTGKAKRDPYVEVCEAARAAWGRARPGFEQRVVGAIIVHTALWSRLWDRVAVRVLAASVFAVSPVMTTGWQRKRVRETLRAMSKRGVVTYEPGAGQLSLPGIGLPNGPSEGVASPVMNGPSERVGSDPVRVTNGPCESHGSDPVSGHTEEDEEVTEKQRARSLPPHFNEWTSGNAATKEFNPAATVEDLEREEQSERAIAKLAKSKRMPEGLADEDRAAGLAHIAALKAKRGQVRTEGAS